MKFVSLLSVICVVLVHYVSPLPVYMQPRSVNPRRDVSQSIVCDVQKLQAALEHVELEQEVPCTTLTHENIQVLLTKLEALRVYAITEEIFDSLSSREHVHTLLQVMNDTLPGIAAQAVSETGQNDSVAMLGSGNGGYDSISCVSDLCRNNCAVCIANCGVHRLRRGVLDLVELLEADYFPDTHMCTVCVDEDVLSEADELGNTLNDITYELFAPRNNFQCTRIILNHPPPRCDRILQVQSWLENISLWMNESLTSNNNSQSPTGLHVAIDHMTTTILPELRKSLATLEDGNCTTDLGCDSGLPSLSQVTQHINATLIDSNCTLEPQLLVRFQMLDLLRMNYRRFVRELLPLYLPS